MRLRKHNTISHYPYTHKANNKKLKDIKFYSQMLLIEITAK